MRSHYKPPGEDQLGEQAIRNNVAVGVGRLCEHLASLNIKRRMTWIDNTRADIRRRESEAYA